MNPTHILAFFTIIVVIGLGGYAFLSHRRLEKHHGKAKGIGGPNDPISGARPLDRSSAEMAESVRSANERRSDGA